MIPAGPYRRQHVRPVLALSAVSFTTLPEAIAAMQELEGNYTRPVQAAHTLTADYFDSYVILTDLIQAVPRGQDASHVKQV